MIKRSIIVLLFTLMSVVAYSQVEMGLRLGANVSRSTFDNDIYKKFTNSNLKFGKLLGGIVFVFENPKKDKYALQTEFYVEQIGRNVKVNGSFGDFTLNRAVYNYIHWPMMFRMRFKSSGFDFYALLGPQVSYWLGGKGVITRYDQSRNTYNKYDYKINFGEPIDDFGNMNMVDFNRWQLGISLGGGALYEINDVSRVAIDVRLYLSHTYMGTKESGVIPKLGFTDNFESTNQVLEVSVIYTFDFYQMIKYAKNKYH